MKITLKDVSKIFEGNKDKGIKDKIAVDSLSFVCEDKELVGLLGPSGCGKSTTLYMISGLKDLSKGEIYFDNDNVSELPPEKRGIGLVFQNYALYPHLTVYKNIAFPLANLKVECEKRDLKLFNYALIKDILKNSEEIEELIKVSLIKNKYSKELFELNLIKKEQVSFKVAHFISNFNLNKSKDLKKTCEEKIKLLEQLEEKEIKKLNKKSFSIDKDFYILKDGNKVQEKRKLKPEEIDLMVRDMARLVHIEDELERKPKELSGGQQQRVAIARALVKKPKVLLLDEPLSNLDARLRIEMRTEIRRIQKAIGTTTIFVTHDQEEAMSICDKIVVMNEGKLMQIGAPMEIYKDPINLFTAKFLGTPPINVFNGKIKDKGVYIDGFHLFDINEEVTNQDVFIAIRPEGFIVDNSSEFKLNITSMIGIGRDLSLTGLYKNNEIKIMLDNDEKVNLGDVNFKINPLKCFIFNKNEERIRVSVNGKKE